MGRLLLLLTTLVITTLSNARAGVTVHLPLDAQIDLGNGPAITRISSFENEGGVAFCRTYTNFGGWYDGPLVDFRLAGYPDGVDMSVPGTVLQYTARYYQGGGNTNPYGDAPIFVNVMDINGDWAELGISYGPNPSPTFPEWITVAEDLAPENTLAPDFDWEHIAIVTFFGTDWAGTGDDFVDIRDLKVITPRQYNIQPICAVIGQSDNTPGDIEGVVTGVFANWNAFYIQADKSCGIRVEASSLPKTGDRVQVAGIKKSKTGTGEPYIEAEEWSKTGTAAASPVTIRASALWGNGITGGSGINMTGRLVKLYGEVIWESVDSETLMLLDPSKPEDPVLVDCSGLLTWQRLNVSEMERVTLSGIASMYNLNGDILPTIYLTGEQGFFTAAAAGEEIPKLKAFALVFDPICPGYGNQKTTDVFGWNDPHDLVEGYLSDLKYASGGQADYDIVDWFDADYHPYFEDGFAYSPDDYIYRWTNRDTVPLHEGTTDYIRLITDPTYPHNQPLTIQQRINMGEFDEVFIFGAPAGFAGWEAAMAGPSPFFVNGGTYQIEETARNFILMGFNYERGIGEMLEDFCHRTECVMSRVYSPPDWWFPTWPVGNNWDGFRMFDLIEPGQAAVGICHYAPNSLSDYDWGNMTPVNSTCDDWLLNWPGLQGTSRIVSAADWGDGDTRGHHVWWLRHLPRAPFTNPDGKQNNWWKYTLTYWLWPESQ